MLPLVALLFVLSGVGVATLRAWTTRGWPIALLVLLALVRLASQDLQFAPCYAAQVANINTLHVAMGRWLAEHTPAEATCRRQPSGRGPVRGERHFAERPFFSDLLAIQVAYSPE